MKRKKIIFILVLFFPMISMAMEKDKVEHLVAGVTIGVAGNYTTKSRLNGFLIGCTAGIAKEIYDKNNNGVADTKDALYTCLGSALSFTVKF